MIYCGPGPFSMAGADMVSEMLRATGYEHISSGRYDTDICLGRSLDDAIEFAMALGSAGGIEQLVRLGAEPGALNLEAR